jgi:hypothetical protein
MSHIEDEVTIAIATNVKALAMWWYPVFRLPAGAVD